MSMPPPPDGLPLHARAVTAASESRGPRSPLARAAALACLGVLLAACNGGGDETESAAAATAASSGAMRAQATTGTAAVALAADPVVLWSDAPGGVALALDGADNVYSAAFSAAAGGDIALTRRDGAGTLLWTRSYDQTQADRYEAANAVAADAAGNAVVAGTVRLVDTGAEAGAVLMRYAPDGTLA